MKQPEQVLSLILLAVAVGLGYALAQSLREQASFNRDVISLLPDTPPRSIEQWRQMAAASRSELRRIDERPEVAIAVAVESAAAPTTFEQEVAKPDFQRLLVDSLRFRIEGKYNTLLQRATQQQREELERLLSRYALQVDDDGAGHKHIAQIMGPERFAAFRNSRRNEEGARIIEHLQCLLAGSRTPLSLDQRAALEQILLYSGDYRGPAWGEQGTKDMTDEELMVKAAASLSPQQIEAFRLVRDQQNAYYEVKRMAARLRGSQKP